jgi:hypothetical protein
MYGNIFSNVSKLENKILSAQKVSDFFLYTPWNFVLPVVFIIYFKLWWKERVNSDGQQFHLYQQNKQSS